MSLHTLTLTNGDAYAVINLVGSALVGLRFGDHEVIPETNLEPKVFAGTLLTPWPNRIEKGCYDFEGSQYQLEIRDGMGNALHGLVDEQIAEVVQTRPGFAKLQSYVSASNGYPANLQVEAVFELSTSELIVSYTVSNQGPGNAPVGIGAHPYFPYTANTTIEINANIAALHGSNMLPIAEIPASDLGLGSGRAAVVSQLQLDTQFSELGNPVATIRNDEFGYDIWQQDANWLMVYNTTVFPWSSGLGNAIAIEPQTCPADAFNNGRDLRVIASGESTSMRWGVRLRG
jgi:aldose 1-epimerase